MESTGIIADTFHALLHICYVILGSAVCRVSDCRPGDQGSNPSRDREFSLCHWFVQIGPGDHTASYSMVARSTLPCIRVGQNRELITLIHLVLKSIVHEVSPYIPCIY
jgi:hypothetical protein